MKKKIIFTASAVHFVLWAIFLVVSTVKRNVFINSIPPYLSRYERMQFADTTFVHTLLIIVAIIGIANAFVIFISYLCALKKPRTRYACLIVLQVFFALTAVVWFVLFASMLGWTAYSRMIIIISWLLFEAAAGTFLVLFVDISEESEK